MQRVEFLKKQAPKVTAEDHANAARMFKKVQDFEKQKELDHNKQIRDASWEAACDVDKFVVREAVSAVMRIGKGCFEDGEQRFCECGRKGPHRYSFRDWCLPCLIQFKVYWAIHEIKVRYARFIDKQYCGCWVCILKNAVKEIRSQYVTQ